jgi:hypothetical protein
MNKLLCSLHVLLFAILCLNVCHNDLLAQITKQHADANYWLDFGQFQKSNETDQKYRLLVLDIDEITTSIQKAPLEFTTESKQQNKVIHITLPFGQENWANFRIEESPMMADDFRTAYPNIKTYSIRGVDNPYLRGRLTLSPLGLHAIVLNQGKISIIQNENLDNPYVYRITQGISEQEQQMANFCGNVIHDHTSSNTQKMVSSCTTSDENLRTYNLAIATTGEFHDANGGTVASASTVVTNTINDLQAIFENDIAVRFNLLTPFIYTDYTSDPFTPGLDRTEVAAQVINTHFTSTSYDIGHVFHNSNAVPAENLGGGGVAGLGVVCNEGTFLSPSGGYNKGAGWSGSYSNSGEGWIKLAAHEFGHMFDAPHTYNGIGSGCTTKSDYSAYEIGSGTTIMSYRSICQAGQNVPSGGADDQYFHAHSIERMVNHVQNVATCAAITPNGNFAPVVNANPTATTYVIPQGTPFTLTGSATDANGDALTYCWEQYDEDGAGVTPTEGLIGSGAAANALAPLFRSYPPTSSPSRTFPNITAITSNTIDDFDVLPTVARDLNFRLTVRDNGLSGTGGGGIGCDEISLTVNASGPFDVTSQTTPTTWAADGTATTNITWDVAGTDAEPISCANVDVLFSTDGGLTFPNVLASGIPNNGTTTITIPSLPTYTGRVQVVCSDNIFFDIKLRPYFIK